ncbi:MAG: outer membrane beta-barrel protein [Calditrichaeota bacterium]|nr:outer membrane beta-barrel protein [Calditrichota bacterium]
MNSTIKIIFISFSLVSLLFSQGKMTEFNIGLLGPTDAESGFYGGLNLGRMVDENVGVSLGVHVYHSSYTKESRVGENKDGQIVISETATELDQSATLIPLFFQLHYTGPITNALDLKVTAGVGYELLWNSITNFELEKDGTDFYSGFGWNVGAGVSLPISRASDFYGELFYHGGSPSRDAGKTEEGFPVRSEIDMGGLGVRIGLRLYTFGL